ncbi:MAG: hypothetical protein KAJ95_06765 [Gammaproteobacteria bacterium]|nr:hypothetical protein [Gammaproteobacteria bacterium]
MKLLSAILVFSFLILTTACSSGPKVLPLKVYSEPAGGYVVYRIDSTTADDEPWIYIGTTPVESTLLIDKNIAKNAGKLSVRVMKEGYFDIKKEWDAEKLKEESEQRKMLFWNPSLVEHQLK